MSLESVISRIQQIQGMTGGVAPSPQTATAASTPTSFAAQLQGNMGTGAAASTASIAPNAATGSSAGARALNQARAELAKGVRETPDGSNNSPDISRYRTATEGAASGAPWCAYFVSYLAKVAGSPLGSRGQGLGYVPDITSWAKSSGKFISPGGNVKPGDLILFPQHVGIVESVGANGSLTTIEGNHSNKVDRVHRSRSEAVGFVRL